MFRLAFPSCLGNPYSKKVTVSYEYQERSLMHNSSPSCFTHWFMYGVVGMESRHVFIHFFCLSIHLFIYLLVVV